MILQNHTWGKISPKIPDITMNFNFNNIKNTDILREINHEF